MNQDLFVLYINDELATGDGSNYHAMGVWNSLNTILGASHVRSFPTPSDNSGSKVSHKALGMRETLKLPLQMLRIVRKWYLSKKRAAAIINALTTDGFTPTHILYRGTLFDTTAIKVAKHFKAKLITEMNAPMYFEHGIMGKLPFPKAIEKWEANLLTNSHGIYTVSAICKEMLSTHYNIPMHKFMDIPNGFDPALYESDQTQRNEIRKAIRQHLSLTDEFLVVFVGSLKKWHGIDTLCSLASELENEKNIKFVVIGDGALHDTVCQYTESHQNMIYLGKRKGAEMAQFLMACDLGLMPYHLMEHFYFSPLKLFDFLGAGLPFLGTSQGQICEISKAAFSDDFLLEEDSVSLMKERILFLANHPEKLEEMTSKVQNARLQFTWEECTKKILTFLS